jgi:hypothetical protein
MVTRRRGTTAPLASLIVRVWSTNVSATLATPNGARGTGAWLGRSDPVTPDRVEVVG